MAKKKAARKAPTTKRAARSRGPAKGKAAPANAHLHTGDDYEAQAEREHEEREERERLRAQGLGDKVYEYRLKQSEQGDIIFLDDRLKSGVGIWEHHVPAPQPGAPWAKKAVTCGKDLGFACALCEEFGSPNLNGKNTVLDLKPWTTKKGTRVEYSKRMLSVTGQDRERLQKLEAIALKKFGTLRGVQVTMVRGSDQKSARIGEPLLIDDEGECALQIWSEEELEATYGHEARKSEKTGKVFAPANFDITPYDYAALFPAPTEEALRKVADRLPIGGDADDFADDSPPMAYADDDGGSPVPDARPAKKKAATKQGDDFSLIAVAEKADAAGTERHAGLEAAAADAGLDYLDFPTWAELAVEVEARVQKAAPAKKKAATKQAAPRPKTLTEIAAAADDAAADECPEVEEAAAAAGIDPNDFASWLACAEALQAAPDESEDAPPQPPGTDWTAVGESADEGDEGSQAELTEAAEARDIDPNAYDDWAGVAEAIASTEDEIPF